MELKPQVFDVTRDNFEELVLQGSQQRVIVVDFWAPWCAPCRTLGPVLEDVVAELGPGIALARVNVDENQELAMAFRVQGIPAVKVVKDGKLVQEFTGAQPKQQVRALLEPLVGKTPAKGDDLIERARLLAERGDLAKAARLYEQVLAEHPQDSACLLALARLRLQQGDETAMRDLVGRIDAAAPEYAAAQALPAVLGFAQACQQGGGRAACARRLLADPGDLEARYTLACCAAADGDWETALGEWLAIVERNRDFRQGAAKEAMVAAFHLLGRDHELVGSYQRRLYQALY
jgi:putative thioredoxin